MAPRLPVPVESEPSIQAEGRSAGPADQNETTPMSERVVDPALKLSKGPNVGAAGEYKGASYKLRGRKVGKGRNAVITKGFIRQDR